MFKLYRHDENSIKELYGVLKKEISEHRNGIRKFAIENKLLSEDEIAILESAYEMQIKEKEFGEIIKILKEKLKDQEENIKRSLINLSMKGFITLKVILE